MASKGLSEFVQQKVRMWFKMLDANQNGSIGFDDFLLIAERFGKAYHLSEEAKDHIEKWLENGISMLIKKGEAANLEIPLFCKIQKDMETGATVSEDRFVDAFCQFVKSDPKAAEQVLREPVGVYFDIFDHNEDGVISPEEMKIGMKCFGMKGEMAEALRVIFSEDKKDQITRKAYVDMWVDFLMGEDRTNELLKVFAPNLV